jgi:hypothetical protein
MGLQTFYGKGPHLSLSADSRAARGTIAESGIHNRLNYCVIFIVHTYFTNVAAERGLDTHGQYQQFVTYINFYYKQ